jgi:hypothetical protein
MPPVLAGNVVIAPTLVLSPDSTGYVVKFPNGIVSSGPMDGGADLRRTDVIGGTGQADVQWTCNPARYDYITAFFRTTLEQGADLFYVDLLVDSSTPSPYLCAFIPGTFSAPSTTGYSTIIKASLEVYPSPINGSADAAIVALFGAYGENASDVLNRLSYLVNTLM